jgi:hypothetical protein
MQSPLVSQALRRAIQLCQGAIDNHTCRDIVRGETPRELRTELEAYEGLLISLDAPAGRGRAK